MVDERAVEAAIAEAREQHYVKGLHEDEELAIIIAIITAYEAARPETNPWRPIEEAKQDGTKICVWWAAGKGPIRDYPERMEFLWWERDCWISDLDGRALTHSGCVSVGAMFRTVEPPTQDAVSQALSTPPAAEEG